MTLDLDRQIIVNEDHQKSDAQLLEENWYRETYNLDDRSICFKRLSFTDIKEQPKSMYARSETSKGID